MVRIPAKANSDSEGNANRIPHRTERSDAGTSIVQEVFAFVKESLPQRKCDRGQWRRNRSGRRYRCVFGRNAKADPDFGDAATRAWLLGAHVSHPTSSPLWGAALIA
jgi:hypothetical protein